MLDALARFRADVSAGADDRLPLIRPDAAAEAPRRRSEAIERAGREQGLEPEFAALVYDTAREERLEPGFAFELVRCGIGVCRLEPAREESVMEGPPAWIAPDAPTAPPPERERRMRASFRRMRGLLERCPDAESAIAAFIDDPDVGDCTY